MKDKHDTSTLFPDGTPKVEEESPLMGILNQIGGAIFKIKENLSENKKELAILTNKFEELNSLIRRGENNAAKRKSSEII